MKILVGLDGGTNSLGWAVVNKDEQKILGMGSRTIPMGIDKQEYEKGVGITKNSTRREKRTSRKGIKRYKLRRNKLLFILHELGMLPEQFKFKELPENIQFTKDNIGIPIPEKLQELELCRIEKKREYDECGKRKDRQYQNDKKMKKEPLALYDCKLKVKALEEPIELKEFGKILYQFNQLRGYSGGTNNDDNKKKKKDKGENEEETKKKYEVIIQNVEILKVEKSEDTFTVKGGKNKGEKLNKFDITILLDEEEVEGQTELQHLEEKVGHIEELEIRIKQTKNGETVTIASPQKSNWRKNMEAAEKILKEEGIFISELRLRDLQQNKWVKIRNRVFLRNRYKEEFDKIWDTQAKAHDILKNCSKETLEKIARYIFPGTSETQQKLRDEAIKNGLKYIIKEQIIYYQRPLKPQTELISNCRFEKEEQVIPVSHPLFQQFRCWKQINNLYVTSKVELMPIAYEMDLSGNKIPIYSHSKNKKIKYQYQNRYLTPEEKQAIYDKLQSQKEVSFGVVIDILNLNKPKTEKLAKEQKNYFLNGLHAKAKLKGCDTLISIKKVLGEYFDILFEIDKDIIEKIWAVIFDVNNHDGSEYEPASKRVSSIFELLQNYTDKKTATELALKLAQNIKFPRKYASLSAKAIQNILPLMQSSPQNVSEDIKAKFEHIKHLIDTNKIDDIDYNLEDYVVDFIQKNPDALQNGGIMESFAVSLVYGKHTADTIKAQITNYHDIKYEERNLRNPIAELLINETMQIIKAIWKQYKFNPEELEIRVELARDLKNSAQEREKIYDGQLKNKKINDKVKERLQEEGIAITDENILKYRLLEQQKYISPYSGNPLTVGEFDTYQIDHIIPKQRYYDNSFSNKVLVEGYLNREKSNRTAWEYITQQNTQYKIFPVDNFVQYVNANFFGKKKKNLLAEKIPSNPVERQLKDTQYISIAIKNELAKIVGSNNVKTTTGEVTDFLRSRWGLKKLFMELTESRFKQMELWDLDENGNPKTNWVNRYVDENGKNQYKIKNWSKRYDHRHHAIDALVVALTEQSHIQRLNNLNKYVQEELINRKEEFKIEQKEDETILDAFFNLEANRRDEILRTMESSRKFEKPFPDLVEQVKEHLETMVVSHKLKDKLGIIKDKFDKNTPKKQLKSQVKVRAALHEETYYGKLKDPKSGNLRDTKRVELSTLLITKNKETKKDEIIVLIDKVLELELITHRYLLDEDGEALFQSMKEAFTGEGLKLFNDKRIANGKQPVYKVKIWYNKEEKKESSLLRLYDNNEKQSVVTGDNYLFLVMLKKLKNKEERVFTVASLYDSVAIANKALKNNNLDFKKKIIEEKRLELKSQILKKFEETQNELKERIEKAKGKKRETLKQELQENKEDFDYFIDETREPKLIPLFTLQQNELIYLPINTNDNILGFSTVEFNDWIKVKENKISFCKRIYKVVKIDTQGLCHFIPNTYANHISVVKDLSKEELESLKIKNEGKKKVPKKDLNFVEFSSYGNCSPYEVGETFINYLKNGSKKKPTRIQDFCIKIQTDWLGNITLV
ncbi:MAG: type II CRISPR RNA-guided endonuclease Cas9 [Bacteroidales bacterium]|jgi:CRISPR subtype II RNA-guided endonuclease Cas9/Csn1|nr:type II CRISPR RNA-guided endonuclease Cas9 [Bacteroidales bacterium]